ncbi:uncharacterized protein A4U43_C02F3320 [Asparagus officinalis]|uniref:Uncharacterized protein n=1 Tax=Asparagus officinalis TaxID=4686 RepID=A0A5P1FG90_ASPOF|nr:uncharacterized protein A4U43_C02F3320 [Asparagus officinalis]
MQKILIPAHIIPWPPHTQIIEVKYDIIAPALTSPTPPPRSSSSPPPPPTPPASPGTPRTSPAASTSARVRDDRRQVVRTRAGRREADAPVASSVGRQVRAQVGGDSGLMFKERVRGQDQLAVGNASGARFRKVRPYGLWLLLKGVGMKLLLPVSRVESPKKNVAVKFEAMASSRNKRKRRK